MSEFRHRPAEGLVDRHLAGRVGDVVVAANHMSDLHERIVDGDDVVVNGNAGKRRRWRGADEDRVAEAASKANSTGPRTISWKRRGRSSIFESDGVEEAGGEILLLISDCGSERQRPE